MQYTQVEKHHFFTYLDANENRLKRVKVNTNKKTHSVIDKNLSYILLNWIYVRVDNLIFTMHLLPFYLSFCVIDAALNNFFFRKKELFLLGDKKLF